MNKNDYDPSQLLAISQQLQALLDMQAENHKLNQDIRYMQDQFQKSQQELKDEIDRQARELERKEATIQHLLNQLYGKKSEKTANIVSESLQPTLFDLKYPESSDPKPVQQESTTVKSHSRKKKYKGQREEQLKNVQHVKKVIEATPEERICPRCGSEMEKIGEERVGSRVRITEPQVIVEDIYTETYACPSCKKEGQDVLFKTKADQQAIPNSWSTPSIISHVIIERFVKSVPYYRQVQEWRFKGLPVSRRTMCNWVMYCAEHWFKPITDRMHSFLTGCPYCHADETPVDVFVIQENGRRKLKQSYVWVFGTVREAKFQIRLYDHELGRSGTYAEKFLSGFDGILITDCYAGYNKVKGVKHAACWAHSRRKFVECLPPDKEDLSGDLIPVQAINKIGTIFCLEKSLNEYEGEERLKKRQEMIAPYVDGFFQWVNQVLEEKDFSSSKLEAALKYSQKHEKELRVFMEDGNVPMTNSLAERTIRPYAVGRKNWLFSGSPKGAEAGALVYSIVESAKANGLVPFKYVHYILERLPRDLCDMTEAVIDSFLPWSPEVKQLCAAK